MPNKEELVQNWKKVTSQLEEVNRFLQEDKIDEALYFIWLAAENMINSLKFTLNGSYFKDHKAKTTILKEYFVTGTLKNDYSKTFEKLSRYRLVAEFHPYTSIEKDYTKEDVVNYLSEVKGLRNEVNEILIKKDMII